MTLQLTGRWVDIDPSQWRERTQVSINVGLGSGNREESRANLMMMAQAQNQIGQAFGLVGPKQAYETFKALSHLLGFENPTQFVMDPDSPEYQQMQAQRAHQPPDPRIAAAQIKVEGDKQVEGMRLQAAQTKVQSAATQAQAELMHGAQQAGHDRDTQAMQMQSAEFQTVFRALAQIVASQLNKNAAADAGAVMSHDLSEVQRGA